MVEYLVHLIDSITNIGNFVLFPTGSVGNKTKTGPAAGKIRRKRGLFAYK